MVRLSQRGGTFARDHDLVLDCSHPIELAGPSSANSASPSSSEISPAQPVSLDSDKATLFGDPTEGEECRVVASGKLAVRWDCRA